MYSILSIFVFLEFVLAILDFPEFSQLILEINTVIWELILVILELTR